MKTSIWMAAAGVLGLTAALSLGQQPVITSFWGSGQLTWTNAIKTNAHYRVEWAADAGGPWHSFTYQPLHTVDAYSNRSFSVEVPMAYRVVMLTNPPPAGMVWIDGGDAELGDVQGVGYGDETPVHTNWIGGCWMDEMEVTKKLWDDVYVWALAHSYAFESAGAGKGTNHPVVSVSWYMCAKWCNARSERENLRPCYYLNSSHTTVYRSGTNALDNSWVDWNANGYRLPTEAEWEKAARGGRQGRLFPWGRDIINQTWANYYAYTNIYPYENNSTSGYHPLYAAGAQPYTSPVGAFPANGYGLHDLAGNVYEWCWDWSASYSAGYATDPRGPTSGTMRVVRGGSWGDPAGSARCSYRYNEIPRTTMTSIGFRCVRGP